MEIDFIHKAGVAYKESGETSYWLRLFKVAGIMTDDKLSQSFISDIEEFNKLPASILKTSKARLF